MEEVSNTPVWVEALMGMVVSIAVVAIWYHLVSVAEAIGKDIKKEDKEAKRD